MTNKEAIEILWQYDVNFEPHPAEEVMHAIDMAINALTAQSETHDKRTETHACDCVSRQAVLDIERNATVDTNPSHFEAHQKFMQFMDDAEISSFGRWQWSNGFNTALTAVRIDLKKLPSAQSTMGQVFDDDCVSRQAAIDAMKDVLLDEELDYAIPTLERLPSAQPEPAIPLSWIEARIEWLKSMDNTFSTLTAVQISAMVNKWKDEQDG